MAFLNFLKENGVMIVVGVLVVGLGALVWFRGPAPAPDTKALEAKVEGLGTTLGSKFDNLAAEIKRETKAKPATDHAKDPAKKAGAHLLADPAEVKEGIEKAAADAHKAGLEKTGVRVLTREEILKMADEAVHALTKTK